MIELCRYIAQLVCNVIYWFDNVFEIKTKYQIEIINSDIKAIYCNYLKFISLNLIIDIDNSKQFTI